MKMVFIDPLLDNLYIEFLALKGNLLLEVIDDFLINTNQFIPYLKLGDFLELPLKSPELSGLIVTNRVQLGF